MNRMDETITRREAAARTRAKAYRMRREGAAFETIGSRLGVTRSAARRLVEREVRQLAAEADVEERRMLHADALMELWRTLYAPAVSGDIPAIDRFLRVEERISRLLGLDRRPDGVGEDSPVQILVGQTDGPADEGEPARPRRPRFAEDKSIDELLPRGAGLDD